MHQVTGRWKLGLALALTTAACWGVLPIALKLALQGIDPYTLTWYRFAVAGVVLAAILAATGSRFPVLRSQGRRIWLLLAVALGGLASNYVFYLTGLVYTTPAVAQVVIQLGPMFFLLGGVIVFKERFFTGQRIGLALLVLGLALFFNRRLPQLADVSGGTGLGVALTVLGAITWAAYGLAQKQLLKSFKPQQILLLLYLGAAVALLPAASPGAIRHLDTLQLWMLAFSCANTLIAYGTFVEALEHWEVSRVGAILSLSPLFSLASVWLMDRLAPGLLAPEELNAPSVFGALLVVGGSAICALSSNAARVSE